MASLVLAAAAAAEHLDASEIASLVLAAAAAAAEHLDASEILGLE